jgi:hypothetical protein
MRVVFCNMFAQRLDEPESGIGVEFFGGCHLGKRGLNLGPVA